MHQESYPWKFHTLLAALGFVPIACLCFALFGWMSLQLSTRVVVLPAIGLALLIGLRYPTLGWIALQGLVVGMLATAIYDLVRLAFVLSAAWRWATRGHRRSGATCGATWAMAVRRV